MERAPQSSPGGQLVGAFGKVPKVGDFVRAGAANEATRAFEGWLHAGVEHAHDKRGSAFKARFQRGRVYAFVMQVPVGADRVAPLGGLLKPSSDSVGRAFPFTLYAPPPLDVAPQLYPHALGSFLDEAVNIAERAATAASGAEVSALLPAVLIEEDRSQLPWHYEVWTRSTRLADVWAATFRTDASARATHALYTLVEMARPIRTGLVARSDLAVRFPLGTLGVTAASFWLDLARCAFRWPVPPSFFWFVGDDEGDILIQFGRVSGSVFTELWWPDERSETVSDLTGHAGTVSVLSQHLADVLANPGAVVGDLLGALWHGV